MRKAKKTPRPKKRTAGTRGSHTERTLAELRARGMVPGIVERWLGHVRRPDGGFGIRSDLFNIFDIVALDPGSRRLVGVQSTGSDFMGHLRKMVVDNREVLALWLDCGAHAELWAWRKVKARDAAGRAQKRFVWAPRVKAIERAELDLFL